jgi:hypothetical protein
MMTIDDDDRSACHASAPAIRIMNCVQRLQKDEGRQMPARHELQSTCDANIAYAVLYTGAMVLRVPARIAPNRTNAPPRPYFDEDRVASRANVERTTRDGANDS